MEQETKRNVKNWAGTQCHPLQQMLFRRILDCSDTWNTNRHSLWFGD